VQQFYRFELLARRAQRDTPAWEKLFSLLYGAASNYGASMARPFGALFVLVGLFALYYHLRAYGLSLSWPPDWAQTVASLEFSASRVFPFGAFEDVSKNWIGMFTSGLFRLEMRILGSVQSALALALVFLFGLAVRRRFQIS
jgi:hypothetical protein